MEASIKVLPVRAVINNGTFSTQLMMTMVSGRELLPFLPERATDSFAIFLESILCVEISPQSSEVSGYKAWQTVIFPQYCS